MGLQPPDQDDPETTEPEPASIGNELEQPPLDGVLDERVRELEARLSETDIPYQVRETPEDGRLLLIRFFPDSPVTIRSAEAAEAVLRLPLETYVPVPEYRAALDISTDSIEIAVRSNQFGAPLNHQLFEARSITSDVEGASFRLGTSSAGFGVLSRRFGGTRMSKRPVLRARGFGVQTPDEAKELLGDKATSFLFEIDVVFGLNLQMLQSHLPTPRRRYSRTRTVPDAPPALPRNQYDPEPLALYAYARDAAGMPLLQFLAYYQAIEFYFPRYSEAKARMRVQNVLKDPNFDIHDSQAIGRLLSIFPNGINRGFGTERDQLRDTLRACIEDAALREFIGRSAEREQIFNDKRSPLRISRISLKDQSRDLRDVVADRIYELRCKIVHTKDGGDTDQIDLLLPNSTEAQQMGDDIALVQLVAEAVVTASSRGFGS